MPVSQVCDLKKDWGDLVQAHTHTVTHSPLRMQSQVATGPVAAAVAELEA